MLENIAVFTILTAAAAYLGLTWRAKRKTAASSCGFCSCASKCPGCRHMENADREKDAFHEP